MTKSPVRTATTAVGLVAAAAIALSGCAAAQPDEASTDIIIGYGDVDTLDPAQFKTDTATLVVSNIYGTLFTQKYADHDGVLVGTDEYEPSLAESVEYSADGTELTITVKPDLKFADGSDLTADDVAYTLQRSLSDVGYTGIFADYLRFSDPADGIIATDDLTVTVQTEGESPLLEKFLSFQTFGILSKADAEANSTEEWATDYFSEGGVSSGPYQVSDRTPGTNIVLEKNPEYTVADLSDSPETVTIQNQPSAEQAYLALQNGSIDIALGASPDLAAEAESVDSVKVITTASGWINYLGMNAQVPALQDVRVRQAIDLLVPYQALRDEVMAGYAGPAYGADPYPMNGALDETGDKQAYDTDPDAAAQLLADAGVSDLNLTLTVQASDPIAVKSATFIQSALKDGGITVAVDQLADAEYFSALGDGTTELFINSWYSWGEDPVYQLNFLLRTGQFTNYARYSNAAVDSLLDQAMVEADETARFDLGKQAQQLVIDDAPWAFLFARNNLSLTSPEVGGVTRPDDTFLRLQYLTLQQ
ncbi:ABC transporter substrate-binding protein [Microbacterium trichothecenolyticum]|uniref:ABC transporter substrate-binding protein n=1 Tax=Microbacterium ureisolvens TaxID=2781186 RepID=A0ABS7I1G8_9MICO|nr:MULTISPECIES: ABC transporter substrate-binding protein [Microbacterium]MBW9110459.1 ABC transporter substrate-binding protein [Microbacterium ureisolvens]MBW9120564.1 ABC transporter substrate-binding protein [Microbacterium trichothecenolyticum]